MSQEVLRKLGSAADKVRELQSDFDSLKNYSNSSFNFDSKFSSLLMSVTNFLSEVDKIYLATDNAFDEIERLDAENEELRKEIEKLENHIETIERVGRV